MREEDIEDDLCIHIQGPFSFEGEDTCIEAPVDGERSRVVFTINGHEIPADGRWHHVVFAGDPREISSHLFDGEVIMYNRALSEDEVREIYLELMGGADRVLSREEIEAVYELLNLKNHPEIKFWKMENNILYLVVEEDKEDKKKE